MTFKASLLLFCMITFYYGIVGQKPWQKPKPKQETKPETKMDLRTDGDVLTDTRKDFFLDAVSTSQLSLLTRNKFGTVKEVRAIVVPSDKLGEVFYIGIVKGSVLVPEDWNITENDFRLIRGYCKDGKLA